MQHLILPVIIWSPIEQFSTTTFTCPKCDMSKPSSLSAVSWTNGCKYFPRLIHDVNSNILLISRIYQCTENEHEVYAHHPGLIEQNEINNHVPFYLWHSTGFTKNFIDYVDQLISYGVSLQDCEKQLLENRVRLFYRHREEFITSCSENDKYTFPQIDELQIFKDVPSRHAITGCFLYNFWKNDETYTTQMIAGSISSSCLWLSCDHTFNSAANIGLFREVDGKWIEQYSGLFCILNSEGEILTWKLTKDLCFDSVEDQMIGLQQRLLKNGKTVEEFYVDNCCSWRKKLQNVFGPNLKVKLDVFHAVQRITKKIPKRHPFHYHCVNDLKLAFRDPSDKGPIRTRPAPDSGTLQSSLMAFQHQWESISHDGAQVLPAAAIREINCILKHVDRGCLSSIKPGRGTNRNERLHRELNKVVSSSRYGVELGYALITSIFYRHNEHVRASRECRVEKPVSAYTASCSDSPLTFLERFGLATPQTRDRTSMEIVVHTPQKHPRLPLKEFEYHSINNEMTQLFQSICNKDETLDDDSVLSKENAMIIIQKAITHYYITLKLSEMSDTISLDKQNVLFVSILALIQHYSDNHYTESNDIENVLSAWNFKSVVVPGDGNCLFTAVACNLIARIQKHDQVVLDFLVSILGISITDLDTKHISEQLRKLVVHEWLSDNSDYYQSFVTSDIKSEAERYLNSGEFAGNLGDLMVVTLSNILHIPIVIFTTITSLPVICVTPVTQVESIVPLYLTYNNDGPGHYDYAIPSSPEGTITDDHKTASNSKCYCGRKRDFKGTPCSADMLGYCRCPCAKKGKPCQSACKCKGCSNLHGTRPITSTRKCSTYETQKQPLCGTRGSDFLNSVNEHESIGHTTVFEGLLLIVFFMVSGIDITTEKLYQAYCEVLEVSALCSFVELPIFKRSQQYIARYLQNVAKVIALFKELMKYN